MVTGVLPFQSQFFYFSFGIALVLGHRKKIAELLIDSSKEAIS
jgi:hypothetical protein